MARVRNPATLRGIADDLGLHVSTVARVLNGMKEGERAASGETAERIRLRAAEVGYRPNPHAASLRTRRSNLVGVLVPRLSDVVLATVYEGIEAAAADHGLTAFVANTQDEQDLQRVRADMMLDRRVDGLILGDARSDDQTILEEIGKKGIPFVLVNRGVAGYPSSTCDNYRGGRIAAEHLLELGHTNVAVIAGLAHASTGIDRPAGFIDRYREAGIDIPASHVIHSGLDSAGGHVAADRFLALDPRPTAFFAVNDFAAIGAAGSIRAHGLRVGYDIALVGFNNTALAAELHVPLTSIDSAPVDMGRSAIEMLIKKLAGKKVRSVYTEPKLVIRASTDVSRQS
ncbi:transcriptional regulator, LacI family [Rhodococcus jostii]|uniref:Transcriptional regulator, LacI family n=1 Tax=Rhodococcus jostii TaxID=132919 RepID=A0A1H4TJZ4_RHOJO|nr:substrate-binding domain-containing protein [Rhodococcus jostii]SEC56560.1 transcriptional regulator, LacI family [Rhodococcus jostii]